MSGDAVAFLAAVQLADSALPVGRMVHSVGLEAWLASNCDATAEDIAELVESTIVESIAPLDGVIAAHAWRAADLATLLALDELATAYRTSLPAREASTSCGRRLARVAPHIASPSAPLDRYLGAVARGDTAGHVAVVEGAVARALALSELEAVLLGLRGAASALLSAAVRLGRLRSMRAQAILSGLAPAMAEAGAMALTASLDELRSTCGELELAALVHHRADVRLFAT